MDKLSEDLREDELVISHGDKHVRYQPSNPTIQTLFENYKDGDLILSPDFQRRFVWNKLKASSLIESIVLNVPLPLIFTAEIDDGEEVVDGQQRLTSIFSYIDGTFPDGSPFKLSRNLKILSKELGGKSFKELDKGFQKKIKKCALPIITITRDSQEDIKFEMFERLNTNITPLTPQELRNCLYRGPYNDFLKRMVQYPDFQYIINRPMFQARLRDVELVLMFCAFYNKAPDQYNTNIPQMLNIDMRTNRNSSPEKLQELEKQFKKSVKLVKHIFGNTAFNILSIDDITKKGSYSKSLNYGLYQIIMYWFVPYAENQVIPYADLIREELLNLQVHSQEFISTLTGAGTNSLTKLKMKFDMWGNTIKGILRYPQMEHRAFSFDLKQNLWRENQICQICSQKISSIDDAEVDHIICYWKGGKTIPENARLTHRLCNRKRGGELKFQSYNAFTETEKHITSKQGAGGTPTGNLKRSITYDRSSSISRIEFDLSTVHTLKEHGVISFPPEDRRFFPGYKVPFTLETDLGEIETWIASGTQYSKVGDPDEGKYFSKGVKPWVRHHSNEIQVGTTIIIEKSSPTRYRLSFRA